MDQDSSSASASPFKFSLLLDSVDKDLSSLSDCFDEDWRDTAEEFEDFARRLIGGALQILKDVDQEALYGRKIAASSNEVIKICKQSEVCQSSKYILQVEH